MLALMNQFLDSASKPPGFYSYCDFTRNDDNANTTLTGAFVGTALSSGTGAVLSANGGWITLSGAATTDNSGYQIQIAGIHAVTANKRMIFKCRGDLNEATSTNGATECDLLMGLVNVDTTLIDGTATVTFTDGFYFFKPDGGTTINCVTRAASSNQNSVTPAAAAFTMDSAAHEYGIAVFVDPAGTTGVIEFAIDQVNVARHTVALMPLSTIILSPSVAYVTGDNTGTKGCAVDYVFSYQDR